MSWAEEEAKLIDWLRGQLRKKGFADFIYAPRYPVTFLSINFTVDEEKKDNGSDL
jgi:hypothetical protein